MEDINTTIIPSKLIANSKVFKEEITNDMVYIAYEPTWMFDVPIYEYREENGKKFIECIIGKFGEMPLRCAMDLYVFAIFKTMEECVSCMEKCGYTIQPYLPSSDETYEDKDINEFMKDVSKLKSFKIFDSPAKLISRMHLTEYKPILKATLGTDNFNQFGNWRVTDKVSLLKNYQQNDEEDPFYDPKCTKADLQIIFALMTVGEDILDDYIFDIDSEMVKDIVKCHDTPETLLTYLEDRFNIQ
jgi:hypothetical protein